MSYDCEQSDGIRFIAHGNCAKDIISRINIVEQQLCALDVDIYNIIENTEQVCGQNFFDFGDVLSSSSSSSSSNCVLRRVPCDESESLLLLSDSDVDEDLLCELLQLEQALCAIKSEMKDLFELYNQGCDQYSSSSSSSTSSSSSSDSSSSSSSCSSSSNSSSSSSNSSSSSSSSGISSSSSSSSSSSGFDCCIGDVVIYSSCYAWGPNEAGTTVPIVLHNVHLVEAGYGPCAYTNDPFDGSSSSSSSSSSSGAATSSSSSSSSSGEGYHGIIWLKYQLSTNKWEIWEDGVLVAKWPIAFGDKHCDPRASGIYQWVSTGPYRTPCGTTLFYGPFVN